jgi:hypothetical protein
VKTLLDAGVSIAIMALWTLVHYPSSRIPAT